MGFSASIHGPLTSLVSTAGECCDARVLGEGPKIENSQR